MVIVITNVVTAIGAVAASRRPHAKARPEAAPMSAVPPPPPPEEQRLV